MSDRLFRFVTTIALTVSLLCLGSLRFASAEEDEPGESSLDRINQQVEEQSAQLDALTAEEGELDARVKVLQSEIKSLTASERTLKSELTRVEEERSRLEGEIADADRQIQKLVEFSRHRLRALYVNRGARLYEHLLLTSNQGDLGRSAYMLRKLQEFDRKVIADLNRLIEQNRPRRLALEKTEKEKARVAAGLAAQRARLEPKLKELKGSMAALSTRKDKIREALTALKAQALRLETVVASMTGATAPKSERVAERPPRPIRVEPYDGPGLFRLKGSLLRPITGEILARFGKRRVAEFKDYVFSKGIEYRAPEGAEVKAIAPGRVLHLGRMAGYGTVVIVDHGERYYSLYGLMKQVDVAAGQTLEKGQLVGTCGAPDSRGRNFYFEIRRNGLPVNPQDYLKSL